MKSYELSSVRTAAKRPGYENYALQSLSFSSADTFCWLTRRVVIYTPISCIQETADKGAAESSTRSRVDLASAR